MRKSLRRARYYSLFLVVAAALSSAVAHAEMLFHFDLPAQSLAETLRAIGSTTNTDIGFAVNQVAGLVAPALRADLTLDSALQRVLAGTGFRPKHLNDHTIVIAAIGSNTSGTTSTHPVSVGESPYSRSSSEPPKANLHLASTTFPAQAKVDDTDTSPPPDAEESPRHGGSERLDEIVVTGTQIHGAEPASKVFVFSRADIESQGFSTISNFVESLPQNFNGGASVNTIGSVTGEGNATNFVNASGVNLRGLGNDSTLVLLNGQRIAPGNIAGNFVDISMIPLSAIERIEIMPDGASAIYGSDAVGGVVNVILRKDLEGAETRVRYGSVTEGGRKDYQVSQSFGHSWGSGSTLFIYDFDKATPLEASDRYYTVQTAADPYTLLPSQETNSVVITGEQDIGSKIQLFGDGTFSNRSGESVITFRGTLTQPVVENVDAYSGTAGVNAKITDSINLNLTTNYSTSKTNYKSESYYLTTNTSSATQRITNTNVLSIDPKLDGTLLSISTGDILFAVGAQYRQEAYSAYADASGAKSYFDDTRNVVAGFAELHVPLMRSTFAELRTAAALELELADRYERYSDFGTTNNPKLGIIWRTTPELRVHGSWGTSFVAPVLSDLNPIPNQVVALPGSSLTPGAPNALLLFGGNPALSPQKSTDWTVGFDFKSSGQNTLNISASYYNIVYKDRITNAQGYINILDAFQYANVLGPTIVQRNVSAAYLQTLEAEPTFENYGVANLASITALVDSRDLNLSSVSTNGIDFGVDQIFSTKIGEANFGLDGAYILRNDSKFSPDAPTQSYLNVAYNPTDLKLRAHAAMQSGPVFFATYYNYVNSYKNEVNGVYERVASWGTIDLAATYKFPNYNFASQGLEAVVGVTNLTDKAPPYVANATPVYGVNYDGANANALGRFIYLQITKKW